MSVTSGLFIGLAGLTSTLAAFAISAVIVIVLGQAATLIYRRFAVANKG